MCNLDTVTSQVHDHSKILAPSLTVLPLAYPHSPIIPAVDYLSRRVIVGDIGSYRCVRLARFASVVAKVTVIALGIVGCVLLPRIIVILLFVFGFGLVLGGIPIPHELDQGLLIFHTLTVLDFH